VLGAVLRSRFRWVTFDLNGTLPDGWQREMRMTAAGADFHDFPRTPVLSREAADVRYVTRGRVHAHHVRRRLPWLHELYRSAFLELAGEACDE
jgi:FMN phosphatase YigB (HAD superfamily)